ncbi:MAG: glycosyltransferase family 2 protein [Gemmatimonadota bacterium]
MPDAESKGQRETGIVERRAGAPPFLSICVPQYNRTSFLIQACRSIAEQSVRDFEICISDDCSNDGREHELISYLESSGTRFVWARQPKNRRYDGNLRAAIALARGEYCFLLGNDDALAEPDTLQQVANALQSHRPSVAICNYADFSSGEVYNRVPDGILGRGPEAAVALFRHVSFVSGVILRREEAVAETTAAWDGSEMYQMYLTARMLAAGGSGLGISAIVVRKDIAIAGETVDSYAQRPRLQPCPIEERKLNLVWIPRLVAAAIQPHVTPARHSALNRRVASQLLQFTYPFWLFEYRRIQSWKYAIGVALGMRPRNVLRGVPLSLLDGLRLRLLYAATTSAGLLIPRSWFERARTRLFAVAKSGSRNRPEALAS